MSSIEKKYNSGIDLLKIVAMFMIVVLHCFNVGGILSNVTFGSAAYYIYNFIFICTFSGVNLYALSTGYLCVNSTHRYSRIIGLYEQVFACSALIAIVFMIIPNFEVNKWDFFFNFLPLICNRYWYFTAYVLLFVFMPLINAGIKNISQYQFRLLLFCLFTLCCIIQTLSSPFGYYSLDMYFLNDGLSFLWIFVMYFFGAYLRLYPVKTKKHLDLVRFFLFSALTLIIYCIYRYIQHRLGNIPNLCIMSYAFPFIVLASLYLFRFFVCVNIKKFNKSLSMISSLTFSVYLITVHPYFASFIQKDIFATSANNLANTLVGVAVFSIAAYLVSLALGYLLKMLFKVINISKLNNYIVAKFSSLFQKTSK